MIRLSLLLLLALCAAAPTASAQTVDLSVIDRDDDRWLSEYRHRGDRWIAGMPGHRYAVRLENNSGQRVLVVLSIDGVNAVTGETAHPSQSGYVLEPWQSARIDGWRKSLEHVAQFVFTDLPDSYAARTGRPDNVGVIGIAVFEEAQPIRYRRSRPPVAGDARESTTERAAAPAAKAEARPNVQADRAVAAQSLGTGHGAREWSPTSRTGFERATRRPVQVSTLRYDDRDTLIARGVLPVRRHWHTAPPRAFPEGFVADPPH